MKVYVRSFMLGARGRFELPITARPISEDLKNARSIWPWGSYTIVENCTQMPTRTMPEDLTVRCISKSDEVSVLSITATNVVREAQHRFRMGPSGTSVLGHAMMGTLLLDIVEASTEIIQMTIIGTGSLGNITTMGSGSGLVKGCVDFPKNDFPFFRNGKLDAKGTLGERGKLTLTLQNSAWKHPKVRSVEIHKGDIAQAVQEYLGKARKLCNYASFGVSFDRHGFVAGAHGYIYQVLPSVFNELQHLMKINMQRLPSLSHNSEHISSKIICDTLFEGIGCGEIHTLPTPRFGPCGLEMKHHLLKTEVAAKGFWQLRQALESKGYVEAFCDACGEEYRYTEQELGELIGRSVSDSEEEC